ncbi:MAG: hypothetical protein IKQ10_03870 [Oscillospiraceae bacterium]|nr:hypothetical protein [Oscillospiraceae bacterium]
MYETNAKAPINADVCVAELPNVGVLVRRIREQAAACGQCADAMLRLVSGDDVPPYCPDEPRNMREDLMQTFELISRLAGILEQLNAVLGA